MTVVVDRPGARVYDDERPHKLVCVAPCERQMGRGAVLHLRAANGDGYDVPIDAPPGSRIVVDPDELARREGLRAAGFTVFGVGIAGTAIGLGWALAKEWGASLACGVWDAINHDSGSCAGPDLAAPLVTATIGAFMSLAGIAVVASAPPRYSDVAGPARREPANLPPSGLQLPIPAARTAGALTLHF